MRRRIVVHNTLARDSVKTYNIDSIPKKSKDGVGTPEEVAYGEGWHSTQRGSPYSDPKLAKEWERGRQDKQTASKMRGNSYKGGIRGQQFKEPRGKNFERPSPANGHIADVSPQEATAHARKKGEEWAKAGKGSNANPFYADTDVGKAWLEGYNAAKSTSSKDFRSERGYVAKLIEPNTGRLLAKSEPYISNGVGLKTWIQNEARKLIAQGKRVQAEVTQEFYDPERV